MFQVRSLSPYVHEAVPIALVTAALGVTITSSNNQSATVCMNQASMQILRIPTIAVRAGALAYCMADPSKLQTQVGMPPDAVLLHAHPAQLPIGCAQQTALSSLGCWPRHGRDVEVRCQQQPRQASLTPGLPGCDDTQSVQTFRWHSCGS